MSAGPEWGEEDEALAAELALGLLDGDARAAAEARRDAEPAFRQAVAAWEERLAGMAGELSEVAPPAPVRAALEARLFGAGEEDGALSALRRRLAVWRGLSLAATAVACVAVGVALLPLSGPPAPGVPAGTGIPAGTILMSHLVPVEGSGLGLSVIREPDGTLQIRRVAGGAGAGRAQEVWLLTDAASAPISLGLLGPEALTTLRPGPDAAGRFGVGASIAISDEPEGGSPTGAPTGAILAAGTLVAL